MAGASTRCPFSTVPYARKVPIDNGLFTVRSVLILYFTAIFSSYLAVTAETKIIVRMVISKTDVYPQRRIDQVRVF